MILSYVSVPPAPTTTEAPPVTAAPTQPPPPATTRPTPAPVPTEIPLDGFCRYNSDCVDPFAVCLLARCTCRDQYFEKNGRCGNLEIKMVY